MWRKRLRNQRPTLVVPPDLSTSVKEIWIGNVLLLETLLVKFLPAPEPFLRKDDLGWVWGFLYIYLYDPSTILNREGGLSFWNLVSIESRNFIMRSCFSCWISDKGF